MPPPAALPAVGNAMINPSIPPELQQSLENLVENLLASESFLAYRHYATALQDNPEARVLLERLSALQAELRQKQARQAVTQADVDTLRAVQAQVQSTSTIMAYAQSQQGAVNFLREINAEISQLLGVDFAVLAKQNSC